MGMSLGSVGCAGKGVACQLSSNQYEIEFHRVSHPTAVVDLPPLRTVLWEPGDASRESALPALPVLVQDVQVTTDRSAPAPLPGSLCRVDLLAAGQIPPPRETTPHRY